MINRFSAIIVNYLLKSRVINNVEVEKQFYQYGIEITLSSIINIALILLLGLISKSVFESVIFLLLFIPIRQFTGGYHASTYLRCNLLFCSLYIVVLMVSRLTFSYLTTYAVILITFICILLIWFMCPVEHINKPIPTQRKKHHKLIAAMLGTLYGIISIVLIALSNKYGALTLYTLLLVTVLVIAAKIFDIWR